MTFIVTNRKNFKQKKLCWLLIATLLCGVLACFQPTAVAAETFYVWLKSSLGPYVPVYFDGGPVIAAVSTEAGSHSFDASVSVNVRGIEYVFDYWEHNGVYLTSQSSFDLFLYGEARFKAVYAYSGDVVSGALDSSPIRNIQLTVDGYAYTTFSQSNPFMPGWHTFSAPASVTVGSDYYKFDHWLFNGELQKFERTTSLNVAADFAVSATYKLSNDSIVFQGPYSEATGLLLSENVNVTVHFANYTRSSFILNGVYMLHDPPSITYISYKFADNSTREYWLDPDEVLNGVYVWRGDATVTPYTLSFLDYTGVLKTYPYVTINAYINGSLFPVEKRKVDMQNNVVFGLVPNRLYHISFGTSDNLLVYGDVLAPSYSTTLQLVVKGADFPKESLLLYPYVSFSVTRDFSSPFGSIIVNYNDSKKATEYFSVRITDDVGVTYYTYSANTMHAFVLNWTHADNQTVYYVTVDVVHSDYGSLQFKQVLANEANAVVLFDLTFLGSWGFNITFLIPIFVLLIIFGSFSYLNAEVGAVLGVLFAIIFTFIGWIPILPGALVTGLFFAVLMALVHNRRRAIGY